MVISTCIECCSHGFQLALFTPTGESRPSAQCAPCGTPIGAFDPARGPRIDVLKNQVAAIDEPLNRIAAALQE